jgi:phage shock protein PspC (stress-responsive transcriptional regulator)
MNKTVNINLAGIIFHVDEDAYQRLSNYLSAIKQKFAGEEGGDEIISDVEARMAELFQSRMSDSKQVITKIDVDEVISVLGEPEDYEEIDDEPKKEESYSSTSKESGQSETKRGKRIFRNPDDAIVGGVAGGLGAYLNIDPVYIRLIFVLSFFGWGSGFLLYLVLWIIVPEARTTAEKLEMRGEDVNLNNIERSIKDEIDHIKTRLNDLGSNASESAKTGVQQGKRGIDKFIELFVMILKAGLKIIGAIIGFSLIFAAIVFIAALVGAMFGASTLFVSWPDPGLEGINFMQIQDLLFINGNHFWLTAMGIIMVVFSPLIGLIALGARLLFSAPRMNKTVNLVLASLFGIGVVLSFIGAVRLAADFEEKGRYTNDIDVPRSDAPILITGSGDDISDVLEYDQSVYFDGEESRLYSRQVHFDIEKAFGTEARLQVRYFARGSNRWEARKRAEQINYTVTVDSGKIVLPNHIDFPFNEKWRNQEVYMTLFIPMGQSVFLDESALSVIDDIENTTDIWDWDMLNHTWQMNNLGLSCMDCSWTEKEQQDFLQSDKRKSSPDENDASGEIEVVEEWSDDDWDSE